MTHTIELIKIDPKFSRYHYILHARIVEDQGKIVDLRFKSYYNRLKFK